MKLKIEKNLYLFLEKNNALDKFVNNLLKNNIDIHLEKLLGWEVSHTINDMITQFVFGDTPEGFAYWNALNTLFKKQEEQQSVLKTDKFIFNKN
ncbi:MAG: hypothetical protein M0R17_06395 [Candidatus Omnitrophica bacterium]|jgi:hypothetical protein|nr:hypothetical protein [Candidatus Omnitrophota bacterium]